MEDKLTRSKKYSMYWYNKASDLRNGAETLCKSSPEGAIKQNASGGADIKGKASPVALMLFGMALECLIKAITVEKGKSINTRGHNLKSYMSQAEVQIRCDKDEYLDILSNYISWAGRYPYPKNDSNFHSLIDMQNNAFFDKKSLGELHILTPNDQSSWSAFKDIWDQLDSIYWKLYDELHP